MRQTESDVARHQQKQAKHEKKAPFLLIMLLIWIGLFFLSLFFVVSYNQWNFSLAWIMKYASLNIENFYDFLTGRGAADGMDARFYQFIVIAVTGAALASCGAIFQGAFKNMFAGPSSMGVMSGGTLGCTIYVMFFYTEAATGTVISASEAIEEMHAQSFFERWEPQLFVLAGCFLGVLFVLGIATIAGKGKVSASAMIVSGMVFSSVVSNVAMIIQYAILLQNSEDSRIEMIRDLMMGSFDGVGSPTVLKMLGIPLGVCMVVLLLLSGRLNLLSLGEEEAVTMGVNVKRYRNIMVLIGTVITGFVVAFCGHVGFIGFMVPLVARRIAGPDMKKLLPTSMLTGAILMTLIFDVAYFAGLTDSMNVITSTIGCVVMVVTLLRRKKGGGKDAAWQGRGPQGMGVR